MISLMQEDTRKAKEHGAENLTIGYFVMKVTLLKTAINYLGEIFSFLNMQTIFVRISQIFVILGFVLMPISPYLRDDCQLIFSATMFVYVFLTAILPPTCACPSVCVIIIGVRLQCVLVSVFLFVCVFLCLSALWFPRLVIFLAFNLTILYCFRLFVYLVQEYVYVRMFSFESFGHFLSIFASPQSHCFALRWKRTESIGYIRCLKKLEILSSSTHEKW